MKAPDKIYIHRTHHLGLLSAAEIDITGQDEQYIRKDALLEWAKEKQAYFCRRVADFSDTCNPDEFFFDGKEDAFAELIDKIESL